ncbi:hypothetical protein GL50803_0024471 [Giardia duodenalis]|uniref:Uncharacterized protein n=1 Tax=Giardia intestinalis (strain ATCC 50803 / WB clone C6) TaxID=184922 RepID=A8BIV0_GIAIC|nr:hypothetical protein GL50803_0024471 [Giardia intestinalis]KAE8304919.1 hypothetical protein GL50803_0024471 [Giardia intestinalis]|eukprot:XP_001706683.1 Hypothetical protein GL50803_24471 [Giardia lamblia ATCC 50803]
MQGIGGGLTAVPAPCPQAEGLLGPSPPPRGRRILCVRLCAPVRGARPGEAALYRKRVCGRTGVPGASDDTLQRGGPGPTPRQTEASPPSVLCRWTSPHVTEPDTLHRMSVDMISYWLTDHPQERTAIMSRGMGLSPDTTAWEYSIGIHERVL